VLAGAAAGVPGAGEEGGAGAGAFGVHEYHCQARERMWMGA